MSPAACGPAKGYIAWGKVDIDASRNLDNRP
jgi:hypothetical protein